MHNFNCSVCESAIPSRYSFFSFLHRPYDDDTIVWNSIPVWNSSLLYSSERALRDFLSMHCYAINCRTKPVENWEQKQLHKKLPFHVMRNALTKEGRTNFHLLWWCSDWNLISDCFSEALCKLRAWMVWENFLLKRMRPRSVFYSEAWPENLLQFKINLELTQSLCW